MNLWGIIKGLLVQGEDDRTKQLSVEVDNTTTTGTRMTLKSAHTDNRTLDLPDATDTLVGKETTDILFNKTIGDDLEIQGTTSSTDKDTGALVVQGGVGIEENLNVGGNVLVTGDFEVQGTTTYLNTANSQISDNNVVFNKDGTDATAEGAGITIERTGVDGSIVYEDTLASKFKAGALGSEIELANVSSTQTLENKTIDATAATGNNTISADAIDISYDNSGSGLVATKAQSAIDEVKTITDGKADRNLGNLTDPTAINQNLLLASAFGKNIGSLTIPFENIYSRALLLNDNINSNLGFVHANTSSTTPSGASYDLGLVGATEKDVAIYTKDSAGGVAADTGSIYIETGNRTVTADNTGDIHLITGFPTGGTRGILNVNVAQIDVNDTAIVNLADPVNAFDAATKNYVEFFAANKTLSNLTNPTAINQELLPDSDNTRGIGSSTNQFAQIYVGDIYLEQTPGDVGRITTPTVDSTTAAPSIQVITGNNLGSNNISNGGDFSVSTGSIVDADGAHAGDIRLISGPTNNLSPFSGTMDSGKIELRTQGHVVSTGSIAGSTINTGGISLETASTPGGSIGQAGNIDLIPGSGANPGKIRFQGTSGQGTAGQVWTSIDTSGAGEWADAPVSAAKLLGGGDVTWDLTGGYLLDNDVVTNTATDLNTLSHYQAYEFTTDSNPPPFSKVTWEVQKNSSPTGDLVVEIVNDVGGLPDETSVVATSDPVDMTTLPNSKLFKDFIFSSPVNLNPSTQYHVMMRYDGGNLSIDVTNFIIATHNSVGGQPGTYFRSTDDGTSWNTSTLIDPKVRVGDDPVGGLSFTEDLLVEVPGVDYTDNVIPTSESPIIIPNNQVAYVTPNKTAPGGNLTVTVDTLPNVPADAVVIARRVDDGVTEEVFVGDTTKFLSGETKKLYEVDISTKANTDLSNLTSPTAINQFLLPDTTATYDIGSNTQAFRNIYASSSLSLTDTATIGTIFKSGGSDSLDIQTGGSGGAGDSGKLTLQTGVAGTGNSGDIELNTGIPSVGTRGDISIDGRLIELRPSASTQSYGDIVPDAAGTRSLGAGGLPWNFVYSNFYFGQGASTYFGSNFNTGGDISVQTGSNSGVGDTGDVVVTSGPQIATGTGTVGNVTVQSGDILEATNANDTGDVTIATGTTAGGGTRGNIILQDGSEGTVGHVWTQTAADGSGEWQAGAAGGDSWGDPVDANIIPDANFSRDLGNTVNGFNNVYANRFRSGAVVELGNGFGGGARMFLRGQNDITPSGQNTSVGFDVTASNGIGIFTSNSSSGPIHLETGNTGGATSADINLRTGTAASTRGNINLNANKVDLTSSTELDVTGVTVTGLSSGGPTVSIKTDTNDGDTLASNDHIFADSSSAAFTLNLPATPSLGDRVRLTDFTDATTGGGFATNNVTVGRNGSTIDSVAADFTLDVDGGDVEFVYNGSTWRALIYG